MENGGISDDFRLCLVRYVLRIVCSSLSNAVVDIMSIMYACRIGLEVLESRPAIQRQSRTLSSKYASVSRRNLFRLAQVTRPSCVSSRKDLVLHIVIRRTRRFPDRRFTMVAGKVCWSSDGVVGYVSYSNEMAFLVLRE